MADFLSQCMLLVSIESFECKNVSEQFWVGVTGHLLNDLFQVDPIQTKNGVSPVVYLCSIFSMSEKEGLNSATQHCIACV